APSDPLTTIPSAIRSNEPIPETTANLLSTMKDHPINRREFLGTTAAGGALFASGLFSPRLLASDTGELPKLPPVKIYKIFAGRTGNFYLTRPTEELAKFNRYLSELEKKLGDVQFVGG